jgi:hypothetical protein
MAAICPRWLEDLDSVGFELQSGSDFDVSDNNHDIIPSTSIID